MYCGCDLPIRLLNQQYVTKYDQGVLSQAWVANDIRSNNYSLYHFQFYGNVHQQI